MKQHEFSKFSELMYLVAEQYGKTLSDGLIALYWQGLANYDFDAVKQALSRHMQNPDNGQFMPKIADVVRMMTGTTQDSALIAWAKVEKALRQVGSGQSVVFDDAVIHAVLVDMGGWIALGKVTEKELPFKAKEFENRYRGYKTQGGVTEYPKKLIGSYEAHNNRSGFKSERPVLIGKEDKARAVYLGGQVQVKTGFKQLPVSDVVIERKAVANA